MRTIHTMTADELHETLRAAGYTQSEYAQALGRSESFVSNLARGLTPMQLRYVHALRTMMGDDVFDAAIRSARRCIAKGECDRVMSRLSRRLTGGVRVRVMLHGDDDLDEDDEKPRTRRAHVLSDQITVSRQGEDDGGLDDEDTGDELEDQNPDDEEDDDTLEDDDEDSDDDEDGDTLEDDGSEEDEEYDDALQDDDEYDGDGYDR